MPLRQHFVARVYLLFLARFNNLGRQMFAEPSCEEKAEHHEISDERPERVRECSRSIFFDEEVSKPCKSIPYEGGYNRRPKTPCRHGKDVEDHCSRCANIVEGTIHRIAMLAQVEGEEFLERLISRIAFCHVALQLLRFDAESFEQRKGCVGLGVEGDFDL